MCSEIIDQKKQENEGL